jgi:hypothetical protein
VEVITLTLVVVEVQEVQVVEDKVDQLVQVAVVQ